MAYLTKYNMGRLCQKLEIEVEITLQFFLEHIYPDPEFYSILNKREVQYLFVYKMLLDNEEVFVTKYYKEVPERPDFKTFVFDKGGKMKYHLSLDCQMLKKDYLDFMIPNRLREISDKDEGAKIIEEYRDWFRSNQFARRYKSGEITEEFILNQYNSIYPTKYHILPIVDVKEIMAVKLKNTKNEFLVESIDRDKIKKRLEDIKNQFQEEFPCKISKKFSKFKHLSTKTDAEIIAKMTEIFSPSFVSNYGLNKLKAKFEISKSLIYEMTKLLLEYIKWTYHSKDKNFQIQTLEKFGLECCHACHEDSLLQSVFQL